MPILAVAALAYSTGQLVHSFVTSVVLHVTGGTGRVTPEGDTEHAEPDPQRLPRSISQTLHTVWLAGPHHRGNQTQVGVGFVHTSA